MPPPSSTDEFLELIAKSGVAEEGRVRSFLDRTASEGESPGDLGQLANRMVRDGLLTYFQADQLLQGKWKRFFIGKYKVLERLGSGGMGQVFLCEHKLMRRRVAVKVLPAAKAADPAALARFRREAQAVAALDHPNVVRAYDIDQDDNLHFLVMEYVDGTNLQDLVKNFGPLDAVRAAHYIYGAAVGLHHAHEMGLVHRDIKPGNILIDRSGVVKILDMGLARFFRDDDDQLTKKYDESILGTADYLAPEQAIDSHSVDIRADLYSLGGTFYYLLTGRPPFPEGTVAQKLLWHQTRDPAPIRQVRAELSPDLAAVVERMMAKDVARRYQTPADVMAALAPWVQTPIPPPDEREMPLLSPAVVAAGTGGTQTSRVITSAPTIVSNPLVQAPPPQPPRAGPVYNGPPTPATGFPAPRSDTDAVATQIGTQPPEPARPAVWDEIHAETQPGDSLDTDGNRPAATGPGRRHLSPVRSPSHHRLAILVVAAVVAVLGVLAGGAVAAYLLFFRTEPPVAQGAPTWYVAEHQLGEDPERTLRSIHSAIEQARTGDVIILLDDEITIDKPILLNDSKGNKDGIQIRSGSPSGRTILTPDRPMLGSPVMVVTSVENFTLSGLVFELQNRSHAGLQLGGNCSGTTIENVTISSPDRAGIQFVNAVNEPTRPLSINNCRVVGGSAQSSGVQMVGQNRNVMIADCRFEGPAGIALELAGPVQHVEFRNNRVYRYQQGVRLKESDSRMAEFSLLLQHNTFYSIAETGVLFDIPLRGAKEELTLDRNFFGATRVIAATSIPSPKSKPKGKDKGKEEPKPVPVPGPNLKPTGNARDAKTNEGGINIKATLVPNVTLSLNPDDDATFLLDPQGRLKAVGTTKVPVGAQPR